MHLTHTATETITAVEMDRRDVLHFTRADGQTVQLRLLDTSANVMHTTLSEVKVIEPGAITALRFTCVMEIDGQQHELVREVSTQNSFYEPFNIAGLHIWPDAVDDLFEFMDETHGDCRPTKHARFGLQDATLRICPDKLHPWCPLAEEGLDIRECYNGEDTWMGSYFGASAHGGLDINHPRGTPIWTPIDIDDHFLFNRTPQDNNNRWRGFRTWPDGSMWTLQVHHLIEMIVPEHTTLTAGTHMAKSAGVRVGSHDHSHFVFKVTRDEQEVLLDPWILFWQMYQDRAAFPDHFYKRADIGIYTGHYTGDRAIGDFA